MKKFLAWPVVVGLLLATPLLFAQNSLAESYRAQMLPMFLDYIQIGSMSDNDAEWMTPGQEEMAARLEQDIQQLIHGQKGFHLHVSADKYLYINIDSNLKKKNIPVLGISAHYDTTPDINGMGIKGRVIHNYDGGIINLTPNETDPEKQKVIDPDTDPYLSHVVGQTIVVADTNGTTNLGADDKAGLTIVMTLLKTLVENPKLRHGPISIVLAPNEDVGRAAERIELEYYHPDYAFDFDGEVNNEILIANFSADRILVRNPATIIYEITLTGEGNFGHQSYAKTNGYKNSPRPTSTIGSFAYDITENSSCQFVRKTPDLVSVSHSQGKKGPIETITYFLRCDTVADFLAYQDRLQHEMDQLAKETQVVLSLQIQQTPFHDPNAGLALIKLVSTATKAENLPEASELNKGYLEPHTLDSYSVDFRSRYFDKQEGQQYIENIQHAVDSLSQRLQIKLEMEIIKQYENVEYGVPADAKDIIEVAMNRAGLIPNFKKERAGTTSAMIMAQLGFGGYTVFTGQVNPHAFTEWLSEEDMFKSYEVALNLVQEMTQHKQ